MGLKGLLKKCFIGSTHNINVNVVKTDQLNEDQVQYISNGFLTELQDLLRKKGLDAMQFTGEKAIKFLNQIPPDVCNRDYLNEILDAPVWNKAFGTLPYLTIISKGNAYTAFCYFEVSKDKKRCTIHLLCSNYKEQTNDNEPRLKLGALLMKYVITLVANIFKDLTEVFLVAETDEEHLQKLVDYYKEFNFIPVGRPSPSGDNNIFQQKMSLTVSTISTTQHCVQNAGENKQYVMYQNRKYLVRHDSKKKAYILSKGEVIHLKNVKHTKLHV